MSNGKYHSPLSYINLNKELLQNSQQFLGISPKLIKRFTPTEYFNRIISSKDSQKYQWTGLHYCDRYSLILLKG
ncbi:hypothetical protein NSTC731_06373 [Nostoc sp. DSM 114167]